MTSKAYLFNKETKEYTGEYKCQPDPMQPGCFLFPSNSTHIKPPAVGNNEIAVWDGDNWHTCRDYRGCKVLNLEIQLIDKIKAIGELDEGLYLLSTEEEEKLQNGFKGRLDEDGNLDIYRPEPLINEKIVLLEYELSQTDWYVVRYAETGVAVPAAITERRAEIRESISVLRKQLS